MQHNLTEKIEQFMKVSYSKVRLETEKGIKSLFSVIAGRIVGSVDRLKFSFLRRGFFSLVLSKWRLESGRLENKPN